MSISPLYNNIFLRLSNSFNYVYTYYQVVQSDYWFKEHTISFMSNEICNDFSSYPVQLYTETLPPSIYSRFFVYKKARSNGCLHIGFTITGFSVTQAYLVSIRRHHFHIPSNIFRSFDQLIDRFIITNFHFFFQLRFK